jgi:DNA polymerase-3 subunit alpha
MKCIDAVNFVKMDFLVVDNVQIVEDTCRLAGIPILDNNTIDFEDINVWNEMLKSGLGIFQFEKTGWRHLKHTLENFEEFKKQINTISKLDVMTALNGIIRPAGDSIRDDFILGKPFKSGMKEIDDSLGETLSYCIYQEQIMMWLYNFCGYTMAQSDMVRRGIAKKYGTEKLIPEIEAGFMNFCTKTYPQYDEEYLRTVLAKFTQVILSASDYGFSKNHSNPYTILGFKCAYLRYYYPLEFLTVQFNINDGRIEKTSKINDFMNKFTDIKVKSIKFRKSKSEYTCDKDTNIIYKGIKSVKFLSEQVADELFELGKKQFDSFIDLMIEIMENSSVNTRQMAILIKLNFFEEFGGNKYLQDVYDIFLSKYKKTYVAKTKIKRIEEIKSAILDLENASFKIKEQLQYEKEYLGFLQSTFDMEENYVYVSELDLKYSPKVMCYYLKDGYEECLKIYKKDYKNDIFDKGDIIKLGGIVNRPKSKKVNGEWIKSTTENEKWISQYNIVK